MLIVPIYTLLIGYIGLVGIMYLLQDKLLFPAPGPVQVALPEGVEAVEIEASDGALLRAVYIPADPQAAQIVFFHGNASSAIHELDRGTLLRSAGFGVLIAEYPGYNGSTGKPSATSLLQAALDSHDWLISKSNAPIHVYGQSLGSGLAIYVASKRDVASVILEAPYNSLKEVAKAAYPYLPVEMLFRHEINSTEFAKNVRAPALLVHGSEDQIIPVEIGKKLFEVMPADTQWRQIDGAGHNDLAARGSLNLAIDFFQSISPPE